MKKDYKQKLIKFYQRHKRMPSYSEMLGIFNLKSKNAIYKLVAKFTEEDFIIKDKKGKLIPGKTFSNLKILGSVVAGFPSPAEEELADTMSLDEYLIGNREASFILKISGDSMKDAGIMEGDMVIVERHQNPKDGDIVIAEVDNEWTVKYLRCRGNKSYLEPANKKYPSIYPEKELKIEAVVKGVIRKY